MVCCSNLLACMRRAMGGSVDFKTALQTRLGVMKPTTQDIERFLRDHPHKVTPGKGVCGQGPWWEPAAGGFNGAKRYYQCLTHMSTSRDFCYLFSVKRPHIGGVLAVEASKHWQCRHALIQGDQLHVRFAPAHPAVPRCRLISPSTGIPELVSLVRSRGQRALTFEKRAITSILPLAYTPAGPAPIHLPFPSTGIPELVSLLRSRGQQVFLVSGGFRQVIHPLAESLDIPVSQVFANTILFNVSKRGGSGANESGR